MPEPLGCQQITFTARPIATAPRDRVVMVFCQFGWTKAEWDEDFGWWERTWDGSAINKPTHWADPEEMKPR